MRLFLLSLCFVATSCSIAFAQLPPDKALASMQPGPGLQVELFASEPMLVNPTAIDVDHKGRVWVAEAVNYRRKNFNRPILREEGDRIQVLVDKDSDGKADNAITFYQGKDLYGPLSVLVLPQADGKSLRVLVAQSPDILEFWDRDGDLNADGPPTKFLSGFGGFDHDHGVHGLTVGPDGKLYFTVGDSGVKDLKSKDGKGKSWTSNDKDCQKGTVWRVDLDGNNLELIAHNFRNNYEPCVDSFGEIWCSDNDDDGNQQTRICHVLPGGNYGYGPRGPGQSHWHEEQPGIVHKTLRTGFGSPTGICFYEGNLLPKQYQGDLIHADAGPREIRYFKRISKGAGYELEKTVMLTSSDNWFRPSDVCVAPDGSVFVADWYDPGVGGHGMGDWKQGRIYRLTPTGHKGYQVPDSNLKTKEQIAEAINNPNSVVRQLAVLQYLINVKERSNTKFKNKDNPLVDMNSFIDLKFLQSFWKNASDISRARLIWTTYINGDGISMENFEPSSIERYIKEGLPLYNMSIKIMDTFRNVANIKISRKMIIKMLDDPRSIQQLQMVHLQSSREFLILMRDLPITPNLSIGIFEFAKKYPGSDRTYLSALNIACGTDPARRDAILADFEKQFPEWNDKVADLVWELRPKSMLPKMGQLLDDPKLTEKQKARIVDILAVNDDLSAGKTLVNLLTQDKPAEVKAKALENLRLFIPTKWKDLAKSDEIKTTISALLDSPKSTIVGLQLAAATNYAPVVERIEGMMAKSTYAINMEAIKTLGVVQSTKSIDILETILKGADYSLKVPAVKALAAQNNAKSLAVLQKIVSTDLNANSLKMEAITALAGTRQGTQWLLAQQEEKKLPAEFAAQTGSLLRNSPFQGERNKAYILFPVVSKLDREKLPAFTELAKLPGDIKAGEALYMASAKNDMQCMKCHKANGQGGEIGPDLSAIGTKGSKENLFESLLYPSRAIADQFVSWTVETSDGQTITGLMVRETETAITIRDANGKDSIIDLKKIEGKRKSLISLMPDDLYKQFTQQELVDLVAYLATLKAVEPKK